MELVGFIVIGVAGWLGVGYIGGAYLFAYTQREFPSIAEESRASDKCMTAIFFLLGPIGALSGGIASILWAKVNHRKASHGFDFGWLWA